MTAKAVLVLGVAAVALAGSAWTAAGGRAGVVARADLRISLWPNGKAAGGLRSWRLRCDPVGGTLPKAGAACRKLAALAHPFAPVPGDVACTQIYGGPAVALVRGEFRGRRVLTSFKRTDGCQTERWNRVRFLFPGVGVLPP